MMNLLPGNISFKDCNECYGNKGHQKDRKRESIKYLFERRGSYMLPLGYSGHKTVNKHKAVSAGSKRGEGQKRFRHAVTRTEQYHCAHDVDKTRNYREKIRRSDAHYHSLRSHGGPGRVCSLAPASCIGGQSGGPSQCRSNTS